MTRVAKDIVIVTLAGLTLQTAGAVAARERGVDHNRLADRPARDIGREAFDHSCNVRAGPHREAVTLIRGTVQRLEFQVVKRASVHTDQRLPRANLRIRNICNLDLAGTPTVIEGSGLHGLFFLQCRLDLETIICAEFCCW